MISAEHRALVADMRDFSAMASPRDTYALRINGQLLALGKEDIALAIARGLLDMLRERTTPPLTNQRLDNFVQTSAR